MRVEIRDITVEQAREMLGRLHASQRPKRSGAVESLVRAHRSQQFKENGASIVFSRTGRLMDGQHRLVAAVKANATLHNVVVVYDVDDDAYSTIDNGGAGNRSLSDIAHSMGLSVVPAVASAVAGINVEFQQHAWQSTKPREKLLMLEEYPYQDELKRVWSAGKKHRLRSAASLAGVAFIFRRRPMRVSEVTEYFSAIMANTLGRFDDAPESRRTILQTHNALRAVTGLTWSGELICEHIWTIVRSWRAHETCQALQVFRMPARVTQSELYKICCDLLPEKDPSAPQQQQSFAREDSLAAS